MTSSYDIINVIDCESIASTRQLFPTVKAYKNIINLREKDYLSLSFSRSLSLSLSIYIYIYLYMYRFVYFLYFYRPSKYFHSCYCCCLLLFVVYCFCFSEGVTYPLYGSYNYNWLRSLARVAEYIFIIVVSCTYVSTSSAAHALAMSAWSLFSTLATRCSTSDHWAVLLMSVSQCPLAVSEAVATSAKICLAVSALWLWNRASCVLHCCSTVLRSALRTSTSFRRLTTSF